MKYEKQTKILKSGTKTVFTAFMKIGKKTFRVKQNGYSYPGSPAPTKPMFRSTWALTIPQMRSILKNSDIEVDHKSTFDGMIDGTRYINSGFYSPDKEGLERLIEQIGRRGLFSMYYDPRKEVFELYSCVDHYHIKVKDGVEFL